MHCYIEIIVVLETPFHCKILQLCFRLDGTVQVFVKPKHNRHEMDNLPYFSM